MSESESSLESASSALARAILWTRTGSVKKFEGVRSCGFVMRLEYVELVGGSFGFWGLWNSKDLKGRLTTSHAGYLAAFLFISFGQGCLILHALIIPIMACFSKLCGHFLLLTGSYIGSRVIGHLVSIRLDVTSRTSSSFPAGLRPLAEVGSRNHVDG